MQLSDSGHAEEREDVAEARVIVEVQPQARTVHEDELAGDAYLGVLALSEHSFAVENVVEVGYASIAAHRAVRLEERHLLGEVALANGLALDDGLQSREHAAIRLGAERAHGRDTDIAIGVVD